MSVTTNRRGLTLVELLIAVGLASMLMVAVFRLLDSSLALWNKGEVQRVRLMPDLSWSAHRSIPPRGSDLSL